jgi:hypothetical protein
MQAAGKLVSPSVHEDKQVPVASFKNSLRAWQARYKAERAAGMALRQKAPNQAGRAC